MRFFLIIWGCIVIVLITFATGFVYFLPFFFTLFYFFFKFFLPLLILLFCFILLLSFMSLCLLFLYTCFLFADNRRLMKLKIIKRVLRANDFEYIWREIFFLMAALRTLSKEETTIYEFFCLLERLRTFDYSNHLIKF